MKSLRVEEVDVADEAEQQQIQARAEILNKARTLIESDQVFSPDVAGFMFKGYMKGDKGPQALLGKTWVGIGGIAKVSVKGVDRVYQTLDEIEAIDKDMAATLRQQLESRLAQGKQMKLSITAITSSSVTLRRRGRNV